MDSKVPLSIFKKGKDTLGMKVSAKPGSKQYMVIKIDDESVGLAVKAPPRDGAANQDLASYIAEIVQVKKRQVLLDKGAKSKEKVFVISDSGMEPEELLRLLKEEM